MINKHFTNSVTQCIIINVLVRGGEIIDYAADTHDACDLVKEYRMAFKSGNVWYRRGKQKCGII